MTPLRFPEPSERKLPAQIPLVWPIDYKSDPVQRNRIVGSLIGLAVSEAVSAIHSVETRLHR